MVIGIKIERFYAYPSDKLWKAIADRDALAQWFTPNDFEPREGCKFHFFSKPRGNWDGIMHCEVLEVEVPRRLVYSFQGNAMKFTTIVTWTLEPQGDGTNLILEHTGFVGFGGVLLSFMMKLGWRSKLKSKLFIKLLTE